MAYMVFWWCLSILTGCDGLFLTEGSVFSEAVAYGYRSEDSALSGTTWIARREYTPSPFKQLNVIKFDQPDDEGIIHGWGYDDNFEQTAKLEVVRDADGLCLMLDGKNLGVMVYDDLLLTVTDEWGSSMEFERSL